MSAVCVPGLLSSLVSFLAAARRLSCDGRMGERHSGIGMGWGPAAGRWLVGTLVAGRAPSRAWGLIVVAIGGMSLQ
jgi:hypothetical protein